MLDISKSNVLCRMAVCRSSATSWAAFPSCPTAETSRSSSLVLSRSPTTSVTKDPWCRMSSQSAGRMSSAPWSAGCPQPRHLTRLASSTSSHSPPSACGRTSTRRACWPRERCWSVWCWCYWLPPYPAPCETASGGSHSWASWVCWLSALPTWQPQGSSLYQTGNSTPRCWGSHSLPWVSERMGRYWGSVCVCSGWLRGLSAVNSGLIG